MKKLVIFLGIIVLAFGVSGVANAYSVNYNYVYTADNQLWSPYAGVTTETFDTAATPAWGSPSDATLGWTWTGSAEVVQGNLVNHYAAPAGYGGQQDLTRYVAVPAPPASSGSATVTFTLPQSYNYLGLWWGSVDTYNTLSFTFYNGGSPVAVATVTGSNISTDPNGNWTGAASNEYVNFLDLPSYNEFTMTSTSPAFEADNISVGNVPVPEPVSLLFLGLGLVGAAVLKRKVGR